MTYSKIRVCSIILKPKMAQVYFRKYRSINHLFVNNCNECLIKMESFVFVIIFKFLYLNVLQFRQCLYVHVKCVFLISSLFDFFFNFIHDILFLYFSSFYHWSIMILKIFMTSFLSVCVFENQLTQAIETFCVVM